MVPEKIISGVNISWTKEIIGYSPTNDWKLYYAFRSDVKNSKFDIEAKYISDNLYEVQLKAQDTAKFKEGLYSWESYVSRRDEKNIIDSGICLIEKSLSLKNNYDPRTIMERTLAALENTLLGKASYDQYSYTIAGRSLSRMNPEELLKWRDVYKREVVAEKRAKKIKAGIGTNQIVKVRFSN